MAGFWERVETWLQALTSDRERLARYLAIGWWVSTAFVVIGFGVMIAVEAGWWSF